MRVKDKFRYIVVEGPIGVGKTALCRQVTDTLHEGLHQVRYVAFSTGNVRDTYNAIATAFGVAESQSRAAVCRAIRAGFTPGTMPRPSNATCSRAADS